MSDTDDKIERAFNIMSVLQVGAMRSQGLEWLQDFTISPFVEQNPGRMIFGKTIMRPESHNATPQQHQTATSAEKLNETD